MIKSLLTLAVGALALVGTVSVSSAHCDKCGKGAKKGEAAEISLKDLKKAMAGDKKIVLIDVNGTASFKKSHIPGALDFRALGKEGLKEALPKDKEITIVAYCGGPACGAYKAGAKAAMDLGYTHVHHFKGGLSGWLQAGEKTEAAAQPES
jgi:rhodanese-related sulfurtransferase